MRFSGARLRAARLERGLTQNGLGALCGKPGSWICALETRPTANPRTRTIEPIARALGVPAEQLCEAAPPAPGMPRARTLRIVLAIDGSAGSRQTMLRIARMAECIEAAERVIVDLLTARDMDDGTWARSRAQILQPWGRAVVSLESAGGVAGPESAGVVRGNCEIEGRRPIAHPR